jgi:hypothetical protein
MGWLDELAKLGRMRAAGTVSLCVTAQRTGIKKCAATPQEFPDNLVKKFRAQPVLTLP